MALIPPRRIRYLGSRRVLPVKEREELNNLCKVYNRVHTNSSSLLDFFLGPVIGLVSSDLY